MITELIPVIDPSYPRALMSVHRQTLVMTESVETGPRVLRQPSDFLRSLVTELLELCPRLEVRDPQSCHGRLVQDICLDTPSLKISKFSQIRKALIDELKVWLVSLSVLYFVHSQENDPPKGKVHNCFSSGNESEQDEENALLPDPEEITEMSDNDGVTDYKMERLVNLLRLSKRTVVFTRSPYTKDKHYGTQCGIR